MAITNGSGSSSDPYILNCWNDLYEIENYRNAYFRFVDNYVEDLSKTYPNGNVPRVNLVYTGRSGYTACSALDFNGATFMNGRISGFRVEVKTTTSWLSDITMTIQNLNMRNCIDVGDGLFYARTYFNQSTTTYAPITFLNCDIEIIGETMTSAFFRKDTYGYADPGGATIRECRIILGGTETLGACFHVEDSIIDFNDVLLPYSVPFKYTDPGVGDYVETFAMPIAPGDSPDASTGYYENPHLIDIQIKNSVIKGSVRTNDDCPTALILWGYDNVIVDVKCDWIFLRHLNSSIIAICNAGKIQKMNSGISSIIVHEASEEDIKNRDKLYEWGFSIRPSE